MMNILYVEPFSGMAGDMFLGALCGLLDAYDEIEALPQRLKLPDGKVEIVNLQKNGIACRHVNVIDLNPVENSGHGHGKHRHLSEIIGIIEDADISEGAKTIAKEIFQLIGEAESKIHDKPIETIHFHEISGVDSIVDIVGCSMLIDRLQIGKTYSDPICTGRGMVNTQHGLLPVPAPATERLLYGMPCYKGDEEGERVTPSGAAIMRFLNPIFETRPIAIERSAYGPGKKDFIAPNVLRLSIGKDAGHRQTLFSIETNLDDCSPELLGSDFQDRLMKSGALDHTIVSALMKKGRPGQVLSVLVSEADLDRVCDCILENTTAIGLRYSPVERKTLGRRIETATTAYGEFRLKVVELPSGKERFKAEYADLQKASEEHGISIVELKAVIENCRGNAK